MTATRLHPLDKRALQAFINRFKMDDWLVLADTTLNAALDGSRPLSHIELKALLDSPLTLRRMQVLEAERLAGLRDSEADPIQEAAANDVRWHGSHGLLLAADSGDDDAPLLTEDGWWHLWLPPTYGGWNMVLVLDKEAPFASLFAAAPGREPAEVALVDGQGRTLLRGTIEDDGELRGRWPLHEAPKAALKAAGGFEVVLV